MDHSRLSREVFGVLANGETVEAITLVNASGMAVRIISYGASIQAVLVPDAHGVFADVTTGYASLDQYVAQPQFFGSTVGRVANRLAGGCFTLNGKNHQVTTNDGANSLHGGTCGFDKVNWTVSACDQAGLSVSLQYVSPDGDQGYPGTLTTTATYSLGEDNTLTVDYHATTDAPTLVNLSNHAYWNLSGEGSPQGALNHLLAIPADHYLPVGADLIPTGEQRSARNSAFDFRSPIPIHTHLRNASDPQIGFGRGYDHNWIIADQTPGTIRALAYLEDPQSGRTMILLSNQPGVQFYSGNFFDGSTAGKAGKFYRMGDAIALEPQKFPDAPHQLGFPSIVLDPGQTYTNTIIWRFGIANPEERP